MPSNEPLEHSELWEMTRKLVAFNTVSSLNNEEAAAYLANTLQDLGCTVRVLTETIGGVKKAMVLAWIGPVVPGGLIISGHIDTVPFEGQPGWTVDPLKLSYANERIYGRGVSDMKVFLAQAILAAKAVQQQHTSLSNLKRPLWFLFTCDEELAGQGSERLVKALPELIPEGYPLPRVALIGEPTNFAIYPAHKGYAVFTLTVHGKGGHSSAPQKGLNAIEKAAEIIQEIQRLNVQLLDQASVENKALFPDYPASVFNAGLIQGGLAPNMIAEMCRLTVSMRIAPGDTASELIARVRSSIEQNILPGMKARVPEADVQIETLPPTPSLLSPTDSPFCQLLCEVVGRKADIGAPYATDAGHFQRIGIDSYICGPGLLDEAHQPNESIPVANFLSGQEKIEQVIARWCL